MCRPPKAKDLVSASVNFASHESLSDLPQSPRFAKFGHILDPKHLSWTSKAASRRGQPSQPAGLLNNGHASELGKSQMAVQIKDESSPLPALLRQPPSTKRVGSLRISKTAPLLLLTWTTTIATPFVWSKNTLVAVVRRGVFDKKAFATLITISFCFGTIGGRQTQVPSSCEGGIYSLDFRRNWQVKDFG